jgi:hypothetical protein
MLLQTNSYVVPKDKRQEHERLIRKIRQALLRIGCDCFEVYEQVGPSWSPVKGGRFIQIMRFRDRQQHQEIQQAEKSDAGLQQLINEFMELIDLPAQQEEGLFAMGHYSRISATPASEMGQMEQGPNGVPSEPPPGEPQAEDTSRLSDLHDEHEAGGNSKPPLHEESEF